MVTPRVSLAKAKQHGWLAQALRPHWLTLGGVVVTTVGAIAVAVIASGKVADAGERHEVSAKSAATADDRDRRLAELDRMMQPALSMESVEKVGHDVPESRMLEALLEIKRGAVRMLGECLRVREWLREDGVACPSRAFEATESIKADMTAAIQNAARAERVTRAHVDGVKQMLKNAVDTEYQIMRALIIAEYGRRR